MKINYFKCVDILALLIQLIGAIMMYLNSPNNTEKGDYLYDDYDEIKIVEDKKNNNLKYGFLLLLIGIVIALISTISK